MNPLQDHCLPSADLSIARREQCGVCLSSCVADGVQDHAVSHAKSRTYVENDGFQDANQDDGICESRQAIVEAWPCTEQLIKLS